MLNMIWWSNKFDDSQTNCIFLEKKCLPGVLALSPSNISRSIEFSLKLLRILLKTPFQQNQYYSSLA